MIPGPHVLQVGIHLFIRDVKTILTQMHMLVLAPCLRCCRRGYMAERRKVGEKVKGL